jgi:hypothetical protein
MNLTIEIPDVLEATLNAKAQAQGITASNYASRVLEDVLKGTAGQSAKPKKSANGLLARYGPGPSEEEIDENRREMFRGFGEDAP